MAGYLTQAMVLIETEKWLRAVKERLEALQRQQGGTLPGLEQTILDTTTRALSYLKVDASNANASFPMTEIENQVGTELSKFAFSGSIGTDFPGAANILALHQDWVGNLMHGGAVREEKVDAATTRFVLKLIDKINANQPNLKRPLFSYALGHLSNIATDVILHPYVQARAWEDGIDTDRKKFLDYNYQIDAKLAVGYFQREDLNSGQSWTAYYAEDGDIKSILLVHYLQALKETYSLTEEGEGSNKKLLPATSPCETEISDCLRMEVNRDFLDDGYKNVLKWAIDVGYDQGAPYLFKVLWTIGAVVGGELLVLLLQLSILSEGEPGDVVDEGRQSWIDDGLKSEWAWFYIIDSPITISGLTTALMGILIKGVLFIDGFFGQGTSSPIGTGAFKGLFGFLIPVLNVIFGAAWPDIFKHVVYRWIYFAVATHGADLFNYFYLDVRSEKDGKEGDLLNRRLYERKLVLSGCMFASGLLVYGIKSTREEEGERETSFNGLDFLMGLVVPAGVIISIWVSGFFDEDIIESVVGTHWPGRSTEDVDEVLELRTTANGPNRLEARGDGKSVRLFNLPEGQTHYPQDDTASYEERKEKDERKREDESNEHGLFSLTGLFQKATQLSGILAMSAVHYDGSSQQVREQSGAIFKDWNLDYRTQAEWDMLMKESSGADMGLLKAVNDWWEKLATDQWDQIDTTVRARLEQGLFEPKFHIPLQGELIDQHPHTAGQVEHLPDIEITGGGATVRSDENGAFILNGFFPVGTGEIQIRRSGIDTVSLRIEVTGTTDGPLGVVITDTRNNTQLVQRDNMPVNEIATIELPQIQVLVHKMLGTLYWPDSRQVNMPDYRGTPLAGRKVFVLPLEAGDVTPQRPANSKEWAALKNRPGVLRSGQPGHFDQDDFTGYDGTFEVKYVDVTVGKQYLVWVEGHEPGDESKTRPEFVVRTFYQELRDLTGNRADQVEEIGRHLVMHSYNLMEDDPWDPGEVRQALSPKWGLECIKILRNSTVAGDPETWAVRPHIEHRGSFETMERVSNNSEVARLQFDEGERKITALSLQCLPLIPVSETYDVQSQDVRSAYDTFLSDLDSMEIPNAVQVLEPAFDEGFFTDGIQYLLDSNRIGTGIDESANPGSANNPANLGWDRNWVAAQADVSRNARRCELLEKTFLVSPQIPSRSVHTNTVTAVHWRFDAITLADSALISIPAPSNPANPAETQARVENRSLNTPWVPVFHSVTPRLPGLSAGGHLYLAPGHGFFAHPPQSTNLNQLVSCRQGWNNHAGEDHNNGYIGIEVSRIARRQGMTVSSVREDQDLTRPGLEHPAQDTFTPSGNRDYLRLWQQNPVYYIGQLEARQIADGTLALANASVLGTALAGLGAAGGGCNGAITKNNHGVTARSNYARRLANGANPIDIYLAIHSNAGGGRGVSTFWLDVATNAGPGAPEANALGRDFATKLRNELMNRCHLVRRGGGNQGVVSLTQLGRGIADLQNSFNHFTNNTGGSSSTWPRSQVNPGGWQHKPFPREIPVSLVEVGFHDHDVDSSLLSRAWFRRLAGEALSMAVEAQLRENNDPVFREDMVQLLLTSFGPTTAIRGLTSDNTPITPAEIVQYVRTATGEGPPQPAASTLEAAIGAITHAMNESSRLQLVVAVRDALAERAGYREGQDIEDIATFVEGALLDGKRVTDLTRPSAAPRRMEVWRFVTTALGWTPATLDAIIGRDLVATPLMSQLDGEDHPHKFFPNSEKDALVERIRAMEPQRLYVIEDLYVATESSERITPDDNGQIHLRVGDRVRFIAITRGVVWRKGTEDAQFQLRLDRSGTTQQPVTILEETRERGRLTSQVWEVALPLGMAQAYRLSLTVLHATMEGQNRSAAETIQLTVREADRFGVCIIMLK